MKFPGYHVRIEHHAERAGPIAEHPDLRRRSSQFDHGHAKGSPDLAFLQAKPSIRHWLGFVGGLGRALDHTVGGPGNRLLYCRASDLRRRIWGRMARRDPIVLRVFGTARGEQERHKADCVLDAAPYHHRDRKSLNNSNFTFQTSVDASSSRRATRKSRDRSKVLPLRAPFLINGTAITPRNLATATAL